MKNKIEKIIKHHVRAPPKFVPLLYPAFNEGIIDAPKKSVSLRKVDILLNKV